MDELLKPLYNKYIDKGGVGTFEEFQASKTELGDEEFSSFVNEIIGDEKKKTSPQSQIITAQPISGDLDIQPNQVVMDSTSGLLSKPFSTDSLSQPTDFSSVENQSNQNIVPENIQGGSAMDLPETLAPIESKSAGIVEPQLNLPKLEVPKEIINSGNNVIPESGIKIKDYPGESSDAYKFPRTANISVANASQPIENNKVAQAKKELGLENITPEVKQEEKVPEEKELIFDTQNEFKPNAYFINELTGEKEKIKNKYFGLERITLSPENQGLIKGDVKAVFQDKAGKILVQAYGGLYDIEDYNTPNWKPTGDNEVEIKKGISYTKQEIENEETQKRKDLYEFKPITLNESHFSQNNGDYGTVVKENGNLEKLQEQGKIKIDYNNGKPVIDEKTGNYSWKIINPEYLNEYNKYYEDAFKKDNKDDAYNYLNQETAIKDKLQEVADLETEERQRQEKVLGRRIEGRLLTEDEINSELISKRAEQIVRDGNGTYNLETATQLARQELVVEDAKKLNESKKWIDKFISLAEYNSDTFNKPKDVSYKFTDNERAALESLANDKLFGEFMNIRKDVYGSLDNGIEYNIGSTFQRKHIVDDFLQWKQQKLFNNKRVLESTGDNQYKLDLKKAIDSGDVEKVQEARNKRQPLTSAYNKIYQESQNALNQQKYLDSNFDIVKAKNEKITQEYAGYQNGNLGDVVSVGLKNVANGVLNVGTGIVGGLLTIPASFSDNANAALTSFDNQTANPFDVLNQGVSDHVTVYENNGEKIEERYGRFFKVEKDGSLGYINIINQNNISEFGYKKSKEYYDTNIAGWGRVISNQIAMMAVPELLGEKLALGTLSNARYLKSAEKIISVLGKESLIGKNVALLAKSPKNIYSSMIWAYQVQQQNFQTAKAAGMTKGQAALYSALQSFGTAIMIHISPDSKYFKEYNSANKKLFNLISTNQFSKAKAYILDFAKQSISHNRREITQELTEQVIQNGINKIFSSTLGNSKDAQQNLTTGSFDEYAGVVSQTGIVTTLLTAFNHKFRGGLNLNGASQLQKYILAAQIPEVRTELSNIQSEFWNEGLKKDAQTADVSIEKIQRYTKQVPPETNLRLDETEKYVLAMNTVEDLQKKKESASDVMADTYNTKIEEQKNIITDIFTKANERNNNKTDNNEPSVDPVTPKNPNPTPDNPNSGGETINTNGKIDLNAKSGEDVFTTETSVENVPEAEFKDFVNSGVVTAERIQSIAEKIKNEDPLSENEQAIFNDKTTEINDFLKNDSPDPVTPKNPDKPKPEDPSGKGNAEPQKTAEAPKEALKDVASTTTALESLPKNKDGNIEGIPFSFEYSYDKENQTKSISEAYHKAKSDGSNPQLVNAVEKLLKPKNIDNESKTNDPTQKSGISGTQPTPEKPNDNTNEIPGQTNKSNDAQNQANEIDKLTSNEIPSSEELSQIDQDIADLENLKKNGKNKPSKNSSSNGGIEPAISSVQPEGQIGKNGEKGVQPTADSKPSNGTAEIVQNGKTYTKKGGSWYGVNKKGEETKVNNKKQSELNNLKDDEGSTKTTVKSENGKYSVEEKIDSSGLISYKTLDNNGKEVQLSPIQKSKYVAEFINQKDFSNEEFIPESDNLNPIEYDKEFLKQTKNPKEVAALLLRTPQFDKETPVGSKEWAISQVVGGNVEPSSFNNLGDRNDTNMSIAKTYFSKKGEGKSLDTLAREASLKMGTDYGYQDEIVTPQDIIDFIDKYPTDPSKAERIENPVYMDAVNRFVELTGENPNKYILTKLAGEEVLKADAEKSRIKAEVEYNKLSTEEKAKAAEDYDKYFNDLSPEEKQKELIKSYPYENIQNTDKGLGQPKNEPAPKPERKGNQNDSNPKPTSRGSQSEEVKKSPEYIAISAKIDDAENRIRIANDNLKSAQREADKGLLADQQNLFGERASDSTSKLFDERATTEARDKSLEPFVKKLADAKKEYQDLKNKRENLTGENTTGKINFEEEQQQSNTGKEKKSRVIRDETLQEKIRKQAEAFKATFKQFNSGINPQSIIEGSKLVGLYIEGGVHKFSDIVKDFHANISEVSEDLLKGLRAAYGAYRENASEKDFQKMDSSTRDFTLNDLNEVALVENNKEPRAAFIKEIKGKLESEKLNIISIRKIAEKNNLFNIKDTTLQEYVESAIIERAKEITKEDISSKEKYDKIVDLYNNQPTISMRSSERIDKQQYSTPLPMSFLAGEFINHINPTGILEPSSGNGMMIFNVNPDITTANEIDPVRLDNLRDQGFKKVMNQDALEPFLIKKVDGVIMNPPFGSLPAKDFGGYKIAGLDEQMVVNALTNLSDNGRAAIIIGGHNKYNENGSLAADKPFINYLYNNFNVSEIINMDGKLYQKQGTQFPTRLILIDGRRNSAEKRFAPLKENVNSDTAKTFEQLYDRVNNVKNEDISIKSNGGTVDGTSDKSAEGNRGISDQKRTEKTDRTIIEGQRGSDSNSGKLDKPKSERSPERRGTSESVDGNGRNSGTDSKKSGERSGISDGPELNITLQRENTLQPNDRSDKLLREQIKENIESEKMPYPAQSKSSPIGSVVPTNMAQPLRNILTQFGDIDSYVTDKLGYKDKEELFGKLAAEQVDSVAMAIYQIEHNQALIIGDMTGVGKGRQAAAMIRYATLQGKTPIFVTEKPHLFSDLYRDLLDIGSDNLVPFIMNDKSAKSDPTMTDKNGKKVYESLGKAAKQKILNSGKLPKGYNYIVTTYSQLSSGEGKSSLKKDFFSRNINDNILVMDESHNAGGEGNTGDYLQEVLPYTKGVVFLSGTFAKKPKNMPIYALKTSMRDANMSDTELIAAIEKGGVPLQEIMSKNLVEIGQMVRRERDFTGVTIDWETLDKSKDKHYEIFDNVINVFNELIHFQRDYVNPIIEMKNDIMKGEQGSASNTKGTKDLGVSNVPFASKTFNLVRQLLVSLKAEDVANTALEELKAGRKPVIAISSTMETFIKDIGANEGDQISDFSYRLSLKKGLDSLMKYTEKDLNDDGTQKTLSISDLSQDGAEKYRELEDKIRKFSAGITISPIDAIKDKITKAGYTIGELTGRNEELTFSEDGKMATIGKRKDTDKKALVLAFNSGNLDVLLLNQSASTGISMHASKDFKDQRQRVMISAQTQLDVNTEVQMRGRIDRTGQVQRGAYRYIISPIPAEQRLIMMFKAKLKSLDANTTSNQKSKTNDIEVTDFLNKYGDEIVTDYLKENREINTKLLDPFKFDTMSADEVDAFTKVEGAASKVSGYVALLNVKDQENFYKEVAERYESQMKYLNDNNANDLEITTLPLNAETKSSIVTVPGKNNGNPFSEDSILETVEVDVMKKPLKAAEIKKLSSDLTDGKTPYDYKNDLKDKIDNFLETALEKETADIIASQKKNEEKILAKLNKDLDKSGASATERSNALNEAKVNLEESTQLRINANRTKSTIRSNNIKSIVNSLNVSKTYLIPNSIDISLNTTYSDGIFMGFKTKEKLIPSNIVAVFATLDGRQRVEIPLSKAGYINSLISETYRGGASANLENWDSKIPTSRRQTRHIVTGNILQAYGTNEGQLITYSTKAGDLKQGILLPESYKIEGQKMRVQIIAGLDQLLSGKPLVDSSGTISVTNEGNGYALNVPLSKAKGGIYFLDPKLREMVIGNDFRQLGSKMVGAISSNRIKDVLQYLSTKHNTSIEVDPTKVEPKFQLSNNEDQKPFETSDKTTATKENLTEKFPDAVVVQSENELPQNVQEQIKSEKAEGKVKGVYVDGKVYMVADNIKTLGEGEGTFRHEAIGHKAVIEYLGEKLDAYSASIIDNAKGGQLIALKKLAKKYGISENIESLNPEEKSKLGQEYIAMISEEKSKYPNAWNKLVEFVRNAIRKFGIKLSVLDSEIQALISKAERNKDLKESVKSKEPKFSLDDSFEFITKSNPLPISEIQKAISIAKKDGFEVAAESIKESTWYKNLSDKRKLLISEDSVIDVIKESQSAHKDKVIQSRENTLSNREKQAEKNAEKLAARKSIADPNVIYTKDKPRNRFLAWKEKWFANEGGILKPYINEHEKAVGKSNLQIRTAKKLVERLDEKSTKLKFTDWKSFDTAFRGEEGALESYDKLPAEIKPFVNEMRLMIDSNSSMLVKNGLVTPSQAVTIEENIGQYVSRGYDYFERKDNFGKVFRRVFNKGELKKDFDAAAWKDAVTVFHQNALDEIENNPDWKDNTPQQKQAEARREGERRLESYLLSLEKDYKAARAQGANTDILKERKDVPAPIRKLLGEYTDPRLSFALTIAKQSQMGHQRQFLQDLKAMGMGTIFFAEGSDIPSTHTVKIASKGNQAYTPLDGLYTTPEFKDVFLDHAEAQTNDVLKLWIKATGAVKYGKTVLSPVTQAVNFTANFGFLVNNGLYDIRNMKHGLTVFKDAFLNDSNETESKFLNELIEEHIIGQNVQLNELMSDFNSNIEADLISNLKRRSKVVKVAGKILVLPQVLYKASDDFFKAYSYFHEADSYAKAIFDKPYSELEGAERQRIRTIASEVTKNTLANYDRKYKAADFLRIKTGNLFGNFLSFQAESIRTYINSVQIAMRDLKNPETRSVGVRRLSGIMSYSAAYATITSLVGKSLGMGVAGLLSAFNSDDEDKLNERLNHVVAPWDRSTEKTFKINDDGTITYYTYGNINPYGIWYKAVNSYKNGTDNTEKGGFLAVANEITEPFISTEMSASWLLNIYQGQDDYKKPLEGFDEYGDYTLNKLLPTAYKVFKDNSDADKNNNFELVNLFGIKKHVIDPTLGLEIKMKYYSDDMNILSSKIYGLQFKVRDGKMTPEEAAKEESKLRERMLKKTDDFKPFYDAAIFFHADPSGVNEKYRKKFKQQYNSVNEYMDYLNTPAEILKQMKDQQQNSK